MKRQLSPERIKQFRNLRKLLVKKDPDRALLYASRCFFTAEETVAAMQQPADLTSPDVTEIETNDSPAATPVNVDGTTPVAPAESETAIPPFVESVKVEEIPAAAPISTETKDGWPVESEAKLWRECPNNRFMIVKLLPDGRLASMYRDLRKWRVNATLLVRLVKSEGEPCYEAVKFIRH
tara:strand:+ start:69 stop:608 length:540 start_codon:yes stop_codon:yes gene_type:complete